MRICCDSTRIWKKTVTASIDVSASSRVGSIVGVLQSFKVDPKVAENTSTVIRMGTIAYANGNIKNGVQADVSVGQITDVRACLSTVITVEVSGSMSVRVNASADVCVHAAI